MMKTTADGIHVKPWYKRWYTTIRNSIVEHPLLTGFWVAGMIAAAVFTGGTILLVPPAVFATMAVLGAAPAAFVGFITLIMNFFHTDRAIYDLGSSDDRYNNPDNHHDRISPILMLLLPVAGVAFIFPPLGVALLGVYVTIGAGILGVPIAAVINDAVKRSSIDNMQQNDSGSSGDEIASSHKKMSDLGIPVTSSKAADGINEGVHVKTVVLKKQPEEMRRETQFSSPSKLYCSTTLSFSS